MMSFLGIPIFCWQNPPCIRVFPPWNPSKPIFVVDPSFKNMFVWGKALPAIICWILQLCLFEDVFCDRWVGKIQYPPKTNLAGSTTSTDFGKQMSTCKKVKLSIWKRPTITISFIKEASKHWDSFVGVSRWQYGWYFSGSFLQRNDLMAFRGKLLNLCGDVSLQKLWHKSIFYSNVTQKISKIQEIQVFHIQVSPTYVS